MSKFLGNLVNNLDQLLASDGNRLAEEEAYVDAMHRPNNPMSLFIKSPSNSEYSKGDKVILRVGTSPSRLFKGIVKEADNSMELAIILVGNKEVYAKYANLRRLGTR